MQRHVLLRMRAEGYMEPSQTVDKMVSGAIP